MRTRRTLLFAASTVVVASAWTDAARAQARSDINPALPNVMLLIDTSGSMEFKTDGTPPYCSLRDPAITAGVEHWTTPPSTDERSKWIALQEVLTGNFTTYKCLAEGRSNSASNNYQNEFAFLTGTQTAQPTNPYDFLYFLPVHRFASQQTISSPWCAFGPDKNPNRTTAGWVNAYSSHGAKGIFWPGDTGDDNNSSPGVRNYVVVSSGTTIGVDRTKDEGTGHCLGFDSIPQDSAGLLDQFMYSAKFGLMTFDALIDPSTGGAASSSIDGNGGELGQWSYYQNWDTIGTANCANSSSANCDCGGANYYDCAIGKPNGCTLSPTPAQEVGARNAAAPPWEGRMVGFGSSDSFTDIYNNNRRIQKTLLALRPYGATPTAGLLQDSETYLTQDAMPDYPRNSSAGWSSPCGGSTPCFGPKNDAMAACRKTYQILLTDGSPNLDLHPWCDPTTPASTYPGVCPYRYADQVAAELYNTYGVTTFVVGFAPATQTITYNKPCTTSADCGGSSCSGGFCPATNPTIDCSQLLTQQLGGQPVLVPNTGSLAGTAECSPAVKNLYGTYPGLQVCCDLAKIAYAGSGGQENAYFATNANALRQTLSSLIGQVAMSNTSRTAPVYAAGYNPKDSFAGQFQFNSSFTINTPIQGTGTSKSASTDLWSGVLERTRSYCDAAATVVPGVFNPGGTDKGDDFAKNVNKWKTDTNHPRRFFSAYPPLDTTVTPNRHWTGRSIRRPPVPSSNFPLATASLPPNGATPTDMTSLPPFGTGSMWYGITSGTGTGNPDFLTPPNSTSLAKLMNVVLNKCAGDIDPTKIGTPGGAVIPTPTSDDQCAQRIMKWELGFTQAPAGGLTPPTRSDVFGAIYRSTPSVIGSPSDAVNDESYRTYAQAQIARPIVLYSQTIDGQLHAFKVDKNPNEPSTGPFSYAVQSSVQNEVWSFFPPAVLQNIQNLYPGSQQFLLDGPVVVNDVRWTRLADTAQHKAAFTDPTQTVWRRVLVAGFGLGGDATGSTGYYALDVTDWTAPYLLWQLTTDGAGTPLFGSGGTPVLTQLYFTDPDSGAEGEYPVVILPGGSSIGGPTGSNICLRNTAAIAPGVATGSTYPVRYATLSGAVAGLTNCYNSNDPSRSLTIVRLDTGSIVRTFRPTGAAGTIATGRISSTYAPDFPITGVAAVFPSGTGQIANRAFVGDAEGLLWRLDLGNKDPSQWKMQIWFDAYNAAVCPSGACSGGRDLVFASPNGTPVTVTGNVTAGQPIQQPPVLSVDRLGNVTVAFSTGDQNDFTNASGSNAGGLFGSSAFNWVWSLKEVGPNAQVVWYTGMNNSERVIGPMSLFDSTLYFTTLLPASSASCASSAARLFGLDYLVTDQTTTSGPNPFYGGKVRLYGASDNSDCSSGYNYIDLSKDPTNSCSAFANGVVGFGPSIRQTLQCSTPVATGGGDPLVSFGNHTGIGAVTPNAEKFSIVVQTGRGGLKAANAQTKTMSKQLSASQTPTTARVDSWAAVLE